MIDRRDLLKGARLATLAAGFGAGKALAFDSVTLSFANGELVNVRRSGR